MSSLSDYAHRPEAYRVPIGLNVCQPCAVDDDTGLLDGVKPNRGLALGLAGPVLHDAACLAEGALFVGTEAVR